MVRQARVKVRGSPNRQTDPTGSRQESEVQIKRHGPGKQTKKNEEKD